MINQSNECHSFCIELNDWSVFIHLPCVAVCDAMMMVLSPEIYKSGAYFHCLLPAKAKNIFSVVLVRL